jgi:hypothetical protein
MADEPDRPQPEEPQRRPPNQALGGFNTGFVPPLRATQSGGRISPPSVGYTTIPADPVAEPDHAGASSNPPTDPDTAGKGLFEAPFGEGLFAEALQTGAVSNALVGGDATVGRAVPGRFAPNQSRPLGAAHDAQRLHAEMLRRIASLEKAIAELTHREPGIGHNQPPEFPFGQPELKRVESMIVVLKALPPEPETIPVDAVEAGSWLSAVGKRLRSYLDSFCSEAAKSAGSEFGKRMIQSPFWFTLAAALAEAGHAVTNWIASPSH